MNHPASPAQPAAAAEDRDAAVQLAAIKPTSAIVYEYGCRLDRECLLYVDQQIGKARALYNDIIAAMREVADRGRAYTLSQAGEQAQTLAKQELALSDRFLEARKANDEDGMKAAAQDRRQVRQQLYPLLVAARTAHKTELRAIYQSIGKNSACVTYQLRSKAVHDGLGWGTAGVILDSALKAWTTALAHGHPPSFAKGDQITQDSLTLQFVAAGGITLDKIAAGAHSEFVLQIPKQAAKRCYSEFKFRLGAAKDELYATGTWQYHRPFPAGCRVAVARLVRKRIAHASRYALQLQLNLPQPLAVPVPEVRQALACVHFGWSADINGRRVAAVADDADPGCARLVRLPQEIEHDLLVRAPAFDSQRDQLRDQLMPAFAALDTGHWPPELQEEHKAIKRLPPQHVAQRRLHRLFWGLRKANIEVALLRDWRRQDRRCWQDYAFVAKSARDRRRGVWRELAIDLARRYQVIAIEPLNLAAAAQKIDEKTGERSEFSAKARSGRVVAAVYELEQAIRWAAEKTRTPMLEIKGQETVAACAHCGAPTTVHEEDHQLLICTGCGAVTDRKLNGAARAWQLAEPQAQRLAQEYQAYFEQSWQASREAKREKSQKLAQGRAKARAARQ